MIMNSGSVSVVLRAFIGLLRAYTGFQRYSVQTQEEALVEFRSYKTGIYVVAESSIRQRHFSRLSGEDT